MTTESRDDARPDAVSTDRGADSVAEVSAERDALQAELDRLRAIPELRVGQRLRHLLGRIRRRPAETPSAPTTSGVLPLDRIVIEPGADDSDRPIAAVDNGRRRIQAPGDPLSWSTREPAWNDTAFRSLAVQVVLYENDAEQQRRLAGAIAAAARCARATPGLDRVVVRYGDCSDVPCLTVEQQLAIERALGTDVDAVSFEHFGENLGSSGGSNALASGGDEDVIWVLNPDTYPAPDAAARLLVALSVDGVGVTEARQTPIEHPRDYDPVTGDTSWASGFSLMIRREVFDAVDGFDSHFFPMYCDDVDLSWRVRLAGQRVVHVPAACVVHDKPISATGAVRWSDDAARWSHLAKLWLYHRFGRPDLAEVFVASVDPATDPIAGEAVAVYRERVATGDVPTASSGADDVAYFVDGRLEQRRFGYDGRIDEHAPVDERLGRGGVQAYIDHLHDRGIEMVDPRWLVGTDDRVGDEHAADQQPFCTVVVRTQGERMSLVDTLTTLAGQTVNDVEVLLMVHHADVDVLAALQAIVDRFDPDFVERVRVVHVTDGGRSAPLNEALDLARGHYLAVLDDDDVVTAEWIETFRDLADQAPGSMVRARCVVQSIERRASPNLDFEVVSGFTAPYPVGIDMADMIRSNRTPQCAYAVPMATVRALGLRYDDTLHVCEDWKFQLDVARYAGWVGTAAVTSVYRQWRDVGGSAGAVDVETWVADHERVVDDLDTVPTVLGPGILRRLHDLYTTIEGLETELGRRPHDAGPRRFTE